MLLKQCGIFAQNHDLDHTKALTGNNLGVPARYLAYYAGQLPLHAHMFCLCRAGYKKIRSF